MLMVANLEDTKWCKKPEKWLKPWHMGTHMRVLSEGFLMNTNLTGFWCFQISLHPCALDEISLCVYNELVQWEVLVGSYMTNHSLILSVCIDFAQITPMRFKGLERNLAEAIRSAMCSTNGNNLLNPPPPHSIFTSTFHKMANYLL